MLNRTIRKIDDLAADNWMPAVPRELDTFVGQQGWKWPIQ